MFVESVLFLSSVVDCYDWDLVLIGYFLGVGVVVALFLYFRKKFFNLKVWCIEFFGGVLSLKLSNIIKVWMYSMVYYCDLFC